MIESACSRHHEELFSSYDRAPSQMAGAFVLPGPVASLAMRALAFAAALGILVLSSGCGGSDSPSSSSGGDTASASPTPTKAADPAMSPASRKQFVAKVSKAAHTALAGRSIKDGCHLPAYTWQCFYAGTESPYVGRLDVQLKVSGDVTQTEADTMSKQARLWFFNITGSDVKTLQTVVTFVNGVDSGTTYRRDVPLLN